MNPYLATSIMIISVVIIMQVACDVVAFVHGWQDGPDSHTRDRHAWLPRLFYEAGWRARRFRLTVARRELEQARAGRERLYRALDDLVAADIKRIEAQLAQDLEELHDEPEARA